MFLKSDTYIYELTREIKKFSNSTPTFIDLLCMPKFSKSQKKDEAREPHYTKQ